MSNDSESINYDQAISSEAKGIQEVIEELGQLLSNDTQPGRTEIARQLHALAERTRHESKAGAPNDLSDDIVGFLRVAMSLLPPHLRTFAASKLAETVAPYIGAPEREPETSSGGAGGSRGPGQAKLDLYEVALRRWDTHTRIVTFGADAGEEMAALYARPDRGNEELYEVISADEVPEFERCLAQVRGQPPFHGHLVRTKWDGHAASELDAIVFARTREDAIKFIRSARPHPSMIDDLARGDIRPRFEVLQRHELRAGVALQAASMDSSIPELLARSGKDLSGPCHKGRFSWIGAAHEYAAAYSWARTQVIRAGDSEFNPDVGALYADGKFVRAFHASEADEWESALDRARGGTGLWWYYFEEPPVESYRLSVLVYAPSEHTARLAVAKSSDPMQGRVPPPERLTLVAKNRVIEGCVVWAKKGGYPLGYGLSDEVNPRENL